MGCDIRIEWRAGEAVGGRLDLASPGSGTPVLLAHGAGAGQTHPFMAGVRRRLVEGGHTVLTFDYPYMAAGRRAPDRASVLLECHRAAAERLAAETGSAVVLAGKSMGGRIGSHLAAEGFQAAALVFYGYPLVSPSSGAVRDVDHLHEIGPPMLFVTGSRDRLAPLDLLTPVVAGLSGAHLEVVEGGDHSFKVTGGRDQGAVYDRIATVTAGWLGTL